MNNVISGQLNTTTIRHNTEKRLPEPLDASAMQVDNGESLLVTNVTSTVFHRKQVLWALITIRDHLNNTFGP
jgi:hypothetical protein